MHVEQQPPGLLILGNSRADNAFDPLTVLRQFDDASPASAFNLGLPGADMRVLSGIVERLDRHGVFGPGRTEIVLLVLDEALVQPIDTLGQDVFFASASQLWADGQFHDAFRTQFRLYGYSANFRQLREPAVLLRFMTALRQDVEPVGGGAAEHLGYRAGIGSLQDLAAARQQEAGSNIPPSAASLRQLWLTLDLLAARGVKVLVVYPPLLNREVLYLMPERPGASPYVTIGRELERRGVPRIALEPDAQRDPHEFVNAGHLNDRGAQRFSALLGQALHRQLLSRPTTRAPEQAR